MASKNRRRRRRTPPRTKSGQFRKRRAGRSRRRNTSKNALVAAPPRKNRRRRRRSRNALTIAPKRRNRARRVSRTRNAGHKAARRNPARSNQRRGIPSIRSIMQSLTKSAAMVGGGAVLFRLEERFADQITELAGQDSQSIGGRAIRAGGAVALGVVIDLVVRQRGKPVTASFTLGELFRNGLLLKLLSEIIEEQVEPRIFGGGAPAAVIEEGPASVVIGPSGPITVAGMNGSTSGMGRTRGGMGRIVRTGPPVFSTNFPE